jgi:cell division septation protein DedD
VPLIASLEKGKYYLQLGAFSRPESVESAIAAIDKTYPLAVQNGGNSEKPLYRILVGPLNLGESGAALQRFKGSGYKDAFVRKIGD